MLSIGHSAAASLPNDDSGVFHFLMYHGADGNVTVNALIKDDTIWLTQKAKEKSEAEYDIFNRHQKIISDFDRDIKKFLEGEKGNDEDKQK